MAIDMTKQHQAIIEILKHSRDIDLTLFRPSFLERRISKRMMMTNRSDLDQYVALLTSDANEIKALKNELTVNVSWLFREPLTWELLKAEIHAKILSKKDNHQAEIFRIWSAGCAHGEEPYTMAILITELLEKLEGSVNIQIIATDMDAQAIAQARNGSYNAEDLKNVPYGLVTKYFSQTGSGFQINSNIKKLVQFSQYDLLDKQHPTPPEAVFGDFDIVICQNIMIYYMNEASEQIFSKVAHATRSGGYLFLGPSEQPVKGPDSVFRQVFKQAKIYKKI